MAGSEAKRERGGFWVGLTAVIFYPLSRLAAYRYWRADRIPRRGGALLVLNHVSHLDPVTDAVFVHRNRRVPRFMAKASLFRKPLLGRMLGNSGGIPVYRGTHGSADPLREAHRSLREGKVVLIYPEGTITKRPDGWPKSAYTGVARLALASEAPVIPIARWGTNLLWNGYERTFRPFPRKTVTYNVGAPIDLSAFRAGAGAPGGAAGEDRAPDAATARAVTDLLMAEVTTLLGQIRGEAPGARPGQEPGQEPGEAA